ncbi:MULTISPECIES: GNAT family N-acetyltransferase [Cupriavidus]
MKDDRSTFDCGTGSLNDWLQKTARQHQEKNLSRTYVAVLADDPGKVVGYYALAATLVQTDGMQGRKLPREVSAVLLARLAVDKGSKGRGLGGCLLMHALEAVLATAGIIGVQCVVVDAVDESAADFYEKYGFVPLTNRPQRLVLPLDTVRQLI